MDDISENPPKSVVGSSSYPTGAGSSDYKGGQHVEDQDGGSGVGGREALSEAFIPVGQPSKRYDSYHHHQFVPHEPMSVHGTAERKDLEFRHCDIEGHEHNQCRACHKVDNHVLHRGGGSNHDSRLPSMRPLSAKKPIRVIAPAGFVKARQATSSSTKGKRLSLSTTSSEAMDRLQQTTRPTTGRPKNPSLNLGRRTLSRQKTKRVEPDSRYSYESSIVEDPSHLSLQNSYRRENLRTPYKFEPPAVKLRGLAMDSTYSSQLPQTSFSIIARARSKETLEELCSYRRSSRLPYATECSICQTKDNQHVSQTRDASTNEQASNNDYLMRQTPLFQAKIQTTAIRKKDGSGLIDFQLQNELLVPHGNLCDTGVDATVQSLNQEIFDNSQVGQNIGDLHTECEYLLKELIHMKKHLDLLSGHYELFLDGSLFNSKQLVNFLKLKSAQKLVTDLRRTLEESQERLLQLEEYQEKHESELHLKLIEMQDWDVKVGNELQHTQNEKIQGSNLLDPYDSQKELMRITNQLHLTTEQLKSLQLDYDSMNQAQEEGKILKEKVKVLILELEKQKELMEKLKIDSESKEQNLISKDHEVIEMEKELQEKQELLFSKDHAISKLTTDLEIHQESLNAKNLILAMLEKEHKQSQESLQTEELKVLKLEEALQQAHETLESEEQHTSRLEQEIQQYQEHLSSKDLIAIRLEENLKQHQQNLLVKDQTIVEMENMLQVHRECIIQTEGNAQNLQKDLGEAKTQLHEALDKYTIREKQMNDVVEKDRVRLNEVMKELNVTKEKLNGVLVELETKALEETYHKRKFIQDLEEAQEKNHAMQSQLDLKLKEEENLRRKSMMDLQQSQEQLHELQIQLNTKAEEEETLRVKSSQDLREVMEKLHAMQAQLDLKNKEEENLRIKSTQDVQELQEQVKSWKELQMQTDEKHKEAKILQEELLMELQASQEQLYALQVQSDKKVEDEKNFKMISTQKLHEAQEQLKEQKGMLVQTFGILEEEKNLRRNIELEFHQVHEQLQAEMKREIEKAQGLYKNSLMDLQLTHGQLKEMKELKAQVDEQVEQEQNLRRRIEQDLVEAKQQLLSEREHMIKKEEEEKHLRRKSMKDLQDIKEKMRIMQHDHGKQSMVSIEKLSVLLAQQQDLMEQLEITHEKKRQLELDHEQALFELEMMRNIFAGLKLTLAKHDLCVDFVEDVEKVLKDLRTVIDHHQEKQQNRREEYSDFSSQEIENNEFSPRRSSASKMLRDMQYMMENQKTQRQDKDENYIEYSNQRFSNKMSKKSTSVMGNTSLGAKIKTLSWQGTSSRIHFSDGIVKTSVFGGEDSLDEEVSLKDAEELKEELEDRLDDMLTTFGVHRDSKRITDETYEKLVHKRFSWKQNSDEVNLLDKLDIFETS